MMSRNFRVIDPLPSPFEVFLNFFLYKKTKNLSCLVVLLLSVFYCTSAAMRDSLLVMYL